MNISAEHLVVGFLVLAALGFLAWKFTAPLREKDSRCCGGRCGCSAKPSKRARKERSA